jgi:hypothetical protein
MMRIRMKSAPPTNMIVPPTAVSRPEVAHSGRIWK